MADEKKKRPSAVRPPKRAKLGIPASPEPYVSDRARQDVQSDEVLTGWLSAGAGPSVDRTQSYVGHQLDPNRVDQIFKSADQGQYLVTYADLWQEVKRRDYQIFTQDRGRRVGIVTKRLMVDASDPTDPVAVGLRNAVEAMIDGIDSFDTETVYQMLDANGVGWSTQEIIYERSTLRFPWGGSSHAVLTTNPRQTRYVHPKHSKFKWDDDRPLLNLGGDGDIALADRPAKWIYYRAMGGDIAATRGFFRPAAWLHLMGQTSMVSGAIMLKLYGIPHIAAYIEEAKYKDPAIKAVVDACLQSQGDGQPTVFPAWMKDRVSLTPSPLSGGGVDVHMKWKGFLDASIAKCVSGAVLMTETSGSGAGSYAQASVHEARSYDVQVCDSIGSCQTLRAQLVANWIELNAEALAGIFGVPPDALLARVPRLARRIDRETSPRERAEILCMFADRGVPGSIRQLRTEYAYDGPDDDADAFRGLAVQVRAGAAVISPDEAARGVDNPKPEAATQPPEKTP